MKTVILISGKQGSGKTTLANNIVDKFRSINCSIYHFAFADPIYEIHNQYSQVKNRDLLISIGTMGRNINVNYWVSILLKKIEDAPSSFFVISDCRRINEIESFNLFDSRIYRIIKIRLNASMEVRLYRALCFSNNDHISETELDNYPHDLYINTDIMLSSDVTDIAINYIITLTI